MKNKSKNHLKNSIILNLKVKNLSGIQKKNTNYKKRDKHRMNANMKKILPILATINDLSTSNPVNKKINKKSNSRRQLNLKNSKNN